MEHLVDANERAAQRDEISFIPPMPWLGFDHDTTTHLIVFIDQYPLQRNWTSEEIDRLELGMVPASRTLHETLAMIQSWLFFGLLESAFGAPFRTRDYVRIVNGQCVMDTTKLRTYIDCYYAYLVSNQGVGSELQEQREAMVQSLRYAAYWNRGLATFSASRKPLASNSEIFTHVARLTVLVGEAVWAVGQKFPSQEKRFFIDCIWYLEPGYERQLKRRITDHGWCPSLFDRMNNFARLPASFLEYMSIYPCPKVARNRHQTCRTRCLEYNVDDPATYQAKHRREDCTCRNLRFPVQAIEDALRASAIAIVDGNELLKSSSGNVIKSWTLSSPLRFVTFSHVWSDGLGSDTERGLPACQVKYLHDLAMKAAGTPYFWVDSLCIPRRQDLRTLAISRMSEPYRSSSATIVIDDGIRRCSTLDSSQVQLLAVSLSTWQERLWTLSESVLSAGVIFAFENDLKSSKDILDLGLTGGHTPVIRIGCTLLDNLSHGIHVGDVTIGALQRNLCRRTCSWLDDESLAAAPLMGIDLAPLLEVKDDERMMRFWKLAKHVPRDIILESSPKFQVDGFRWAPKSLMDLKCDVLLDFKDQSATVMDEGLCGNYFLYRLHCPGPLKWSQSYGFYEPNSKCCLHLEKEENTVQDYLRPGDVICFTDRLTIAQPRLGALLHPVRDATGTLPKYRYGTVASANLRHFEKTRESFLGSLFIGALEMMGSLLVRADEEFGEILIC
jgi:Heterokaryon incompatibility protein (HET)